MQPSGSGTPPDDRERTLDVGAPSVALAEPTPGTRVGRYEIREKLGEGGMGVVFRAHDRALDRDVALKRVRVSRASGINEARLLREAQAMAKLSHPNVVPVFTAELIDDEVVIAMEIVEGETLRQHLRRAVEDWRGIVRLFIGAGRGLEAAHRADLVHRDFKPGNVLVDAQGRARVMDFGLARAGDTAAPRADTPSSLASGVTSSSLTTAGNVMGTPRYMAPEQHTGQPVDGRADQFAFCVAMFGALYGAPPYVGERYEDLVAAKVRGDVTPPPPDRARAVPRRLHRALLRGLRPDPSDRFDDMTALIAELEAVGAPAQRAWVALSMGAGVLVVAAGLGAWTYGEGRPATCLDGPTPIDDVWDDDARRRLGERFATIDPAEPDPTGPRVTAHLDAAADAWVEAYRDACQATHIHGEQTAQALDLRMACLDGQANAIAATLTVLEETDVTSIVHAVQTASGLPDPDRCADIDALQSELPPPPGDQARIEVAQVRAVLERAAALQRAGRYEDAQIEAQAALTSAQATGYRPVVVEAMGRLGAATERRGDFDRAAELVTEAYYEAKQLGHSSQVIALATQLIYLDGYRRQDHEAARRWTRDATAEIERRGGDDDAMAGVASHAGMVAMMAGDLDESIAQFEYVLSVEQRAEPPRPLGLASAHDKLGTIYYSTEQLEPARRHLQRAVALYEEALGSEHPKLLPSLTNLGGTLMTLERPEASLKPLRRAEAIAVRVYGEDHADVGMIRNHLGNSLSKLDRHEDADRQLAAAVRTLEATLGPEHQYTIAARSNWASAKSRAGDHAGALQMFEAAYDAQRGTVPDDHPAIGDFESNLGMELSALGRHAEALVHHRAALPIFETHYGPTSVVYALGLGRVGGSLVALERYDESLEALEPFVAIELPAHVPAHDAAPPRFDLARALWETGGDPARARRLATEAAARLEAAGNDRAPIDAWLSSHPGAT